MKLKTKDLSVIALLSALAYVMMFVGRVPVVLFLKYDPKDIIITIGGFIYGAQTAILMSIIVSVIEFMTVSTTGIIGLFMNVLSTVAFAAPAAYFYRKTMDDKGMVKGLVVGSVLMTALMLLWNYIVTPWFMGVPREEVVKLLVPAILPFNILKSVLNATLTFILYRPLLKVLNRTNIINKKPVNEKSKKTSYLVALLLFITAVLYVLSLNGII